jgi:hypothetical protein
MLGTVATAALIGAPTAAAQTTTYYRWGYTDRTYFHFGNPLFGQVRVESWVDERRVCSNGDCNLAIRGHGHVEKFPLAVRVQVDHVRLGNATQGGVFAEEPKDDNSGTGAFAESVTSWIDVLDGTFCADPFEAWTRTFWSVRWTDNYLSRSSTLSARSGHTWCDAT